jgi:transcriptional regulator with XRE-family HTH domain
MGKNSTQAMISPVQARMARAALGWTLADLAERTQLKPNTVHNFERGEGRSRRSTLATIRRAFEDAGVEFIDTDGVRVPALG